MQNIRQAALDGEVELLYVDETGMSCQPNVQRGWSPRGKPHCTDASSSNRRVNVLGALDYANRRLVIGPTFWPTGDAEADLREILQFYRGYVPKKPENAFYGE